MAKTRQMTLRCGYPDCVNEPRPEQEGSAQPGYCGRPDPVTGEPHTALTRISTQAVRGNPFGGRETALTCDEADRQTRRQQQILLRSACQITLL